MFSTSMFDLSITPIDVSFSRLRARSTEVVDDFSKLREWESLCIISSLIGMIAFLLRSHFSS